MAELLDVIRLIGTEKTSTEILGILDTTVVKSTDSLPRNYSDVVNLFGLEAAEGILQVLKGAGLDGAASIYTGRGIDLSLEVTQNQLTSIGTTHPEFSEICESLKNLGISRWKNYEKYGLTALPTEQDVSDALSYIGVLDWANGMWAGIVQPMLSQKKTISEIKEAIGNS